MELLNEHKIGFGEAHVLFLGVLHKAGCENIFKLSHHMHQQMVRSRTTGEPSYRQDQFNEGRLERGTDSPESSGS